MGMVRIESFDLFLILKEPCSVFGSCVLLVGFSHTQSFQFLSAWSGYVLNLYRAERCCSGGRASVHQLRKLCPHCCGQHGLLLCWASGMAHLVVAHADLFTALLVCFDNALLKSLASFFKDTRLVFFLCHYLDLVSRLCWPHVNSF